MKAGATIVRLANLEPGPVLDGLVDVLIDCVEGGASVSFMSPLSRERAQAFWTVVAAELLRGLREVLVATDAEGRVLGTVQLAMDTPQNQPHRADVAKLLVHRRARRQGLAERLLRGLEDVALERGRTVLTLDTVTGGDAERLYGRLGWCKVGSIPDYALYPDGRYCATTVFYKRLLQPNSAAEGACDP